MAVTGVVCEYNPFHNGHAWHLRQCREHLPEESTVLCVMSGDFVQRGEAALFSKYARAETACRCGADLVAELPLPWALSSAEGFARGAVSMLNALGAEYLSFGTETAEPEILAGLAEELDRAELQDEIRRKLKETGNLSYAQARQQLLEERLGERAQLLSTPNNILAVEYLKAIRTLGSSMKPLAVRRIGSGHDRQSSEAGFRSASQLREMLMRGEEINSDIPREAAPVLQREREQGRMLRPEILETACLSRLRMLDRVTFSRLPDASDGLGNRLYSAVREHGDLAGVFAAARTRRYPMARVRRACMCACLGVTAEMSRGLPPYARILAMNEKGRAYLASIRDSVELPVLIRPAAVRAFPEPCAALFALGASAHDLFVLAYDSPAQRTGGEDWRKGPALVENE